MPFLVFFLCSDRRTDSSDDFFCLFSEITESGDNVSLDAVASLMNSIDSEVVWECYNTFLSVTKSPIIQSECHHKYPFSNKTALLKIDISINCTRLQCKQFFLKRERASESKFYKKLQKKLKLIWIINTFWMQIVGKTCKTYSTLFL